MNFYKVTYDTGPTVGKTVIVSEDAEQYLPLAVARKDPKYRLNNRFCKITDSKILSLDEVKLSDLSVLELLIILRLEKDGNINE